MVEESPEVRSVVLLWEKAYNRHAPATVQSLYSSSDVTTFIGTDADEWWVGRDVAAALSKHMEQLEGIPMSYEVERVEAYREGNIGWAGVLSRVDIGDRPTQWFRETHVLRLEDGAWKILHSHSSVAIPNQEVVGVELTTSLEDLLTTLGAEAERESPTLASEGTITLMFTDIESSTRLAREVGDQRWAAVMEWHDANIKGIVESHGGAVVKTLGDGAMIAFEAAQPAARAAMQIQRAIAGRTEAPPLRLRIGIHTGDVVRTESDYLGHAVNKAARIAAAAEGGQIMTSNVARAMLADSPEFTFGATADVELKGLDGVHEVAPLLVAE